MRHKNLRLITLLLLGLGFMVLQAQTTGTFTDSRDGKEYKTVKIGRKVWMAENLAYNHSSYNNDSINVPVLGYKYNWETACDVCPEGWHLPSMNEYKALYYRFAIGIDESLQKRNAYFNLIAGGSSGFSALTNAYWSSTKKGKTEAYILSFNQYQKCYLYLCNRMDFLSVRCVKD